MARTMFGSELTPGHRSSWSFASHCAYRGFDATEENNGLYNCSNTCAIAQLKLTKLHDLDYIYCVRKIRFTHTRQKNLSLCLSVCSGLMDHLDLSKELARQCLDRMADEGIFVKVGITLSSVVGSIVNFAPFLVLIRRFIFYACRIALTCDSV